MSDSEILDWMQENYTSLVPDYLELHIMTWIDADGRNRWVTGASLRECVEFAATSEAKP